MKKINILLSAGGTGGHVIPAQQLAEILTEKSFFSVFFMAKGLSNNQNFKKDKYKYIDISSSQISRKKIFLAPFSLLKGTFQSVYHILRQKPEIVVGFGSYHTFPVLLAALFLKKPIILFESNASLGKVNRFFASKARVVATQFEIDKREKYQHLSLVSLLPWIDEKKKLDKFLSREKLNLKEDLFTFLIFGGSQGAEFINEEFSFSASQLIKEKKFQVIHLCGSMKEKERLQKLYKSHGISSYVSEYEKDMCPIYSSADLAICRAGAATIGELIFFELPSILIPFLHASEGHQKINALFLKEVGGACLVEQNNFNRDLFFSFLREMMDRENGNLNKMKDNLLKFKQQINNEKRKTLAMLIEEVGRKI